MDIQPWLARYLRQQNPDGISRRLRARLCADCGVMTLAGLDADVCAFPIYLHPVPLTARGEAVALVLGLRTYSIHMRQRAGYCADRRDPLALSSRPAGSAHVLAVHSCTLTLPAALYERLSAARGAAGYDDDPPF